MQWISLKDRLPEDGQKVLVWEDHGSEMEGDIELVTFKHIRYEWDETVEHGQSGYPKRLEVEDPHFHWMGGDNDCDWRQSENFFRQGGYGYEESCDDRGVSKIAHVTHWAPIPERPM